MKQTDIPNMDPLILEYPLGDNPPKATLYYGENSLLVLKDIPDNSVQCCVTSPPYFGLRDYGTDPVTWEGDAPWKGELGSEPTVEMYVQHLVEIFREVRRVLHPTGTLWLNLGDSYSNSGGSGGDYSKGGIREGQPKVKRKTIQELKPKDLMGVPWMAAFALRADGWWLRSEIIWAKSLSFCPTYVGQCMPASVRDRPVSSHEHVFLLGKSQKYFYDLDACKEKWVDDREGCAGGDSNFYNANAKGFTGPPRDWEPPKDSKGRSLRTVWTVNPSGFAGAHFAVFPPKLVEPMIKLGSSERGCCPTCKAPWVRVTERHAEFRGNSAKAGRTSEELNESGKWQRGTSEGNQNLKMGPVVTVNTLDWEPSCQCPLAAPIPCLVLDPFSGSGTTGMVALQQHRNYLGIDAQAKYLPLAESRILGDTVPRPSEEASEKEENPILEMFREW